MVKGEIDGTTLSSTRSKVMEHIDLNDNVRAMSFSVAIATARCSACGTLGQVLALALPDGHEVIDEFTAEWAPVAAVVLLSFVARLSDGALARLRAYAANYRLDLSLPHEDAYWANVCPHCGAGFDEDALHSEPDVAFVPSSEARAGTIELHHIGQPIIACARGLSLAPTFFHAMRRA